MKLSRILSIALSSTLAVAIFAQSEEVIIPFDDASLEKELHIKVFQGDITIKGTNRQDVSVTYEIIEDEKEPNPVSTDEQGLKKISGGNLDLEMSSNDNLAQIKSHNWNKNIRLTIDVPTSIQLNIQKNIGGNVMVSDVEGKINIENNVGDIEVKNTVGMVSASTNAGDITCHFKEIPEAQNMLFTTTTGKIDLSLPSQFAANLKLKTDMGDIYSDLDLQMVKKELEPKTKEDGGSFKFFHSDYTFATINGGGPELTIKSKLGSIYLRAST